MAEKYELYRLRGIITNLEQAVNDLVAPAYDSNWIAKVKSDIEDSIAELEDLMDDFIDIRGARDKVIEEMETLPLLPPECEHDKAYATYILASNPPRSPWICRKCKKQGHDVMGPVSSGTEYMELLHDIIEKTVKGEKK